MTIETGKVYTFKFNSGEEIIARIESQVDNTVMVSTPVSVAHGPQGMGLVPSLFTADPGVAVAVNMQCVAIHAPTDDAVRMKYIEATTGIKVPEKKILVG